VAIGDAGGGDMIALALDSGHVFQWEHEAGVKRGFLSRMRRQGRL
jgi:hypothetical protein